MAEQRADFAYTTVLAGGYTAGSGILNVTSSGAGAGLEAFPASGNFSVVIADQITGLPKTLLEVTAIASATRFTVTNNGLTPDVNCVAGDFVYCVQDARSLNALAAGGSWIALASLYQNGWSDGAAQAGQYRLDPTGTVSLRGLIVPGTITAGTLLFTLPAGFRPASAQRAFGVADNGSVASSVNMRLDIATNGQVTLGYAFPTAVYLDLGPVSFSVN